MTQPSPRDLVRLKQALGSRVLTARRVSRGYTPAQRWLLSLANGQRAFAKVGVNANTATWLRAEDLAYAGLRKQGATFLPEVLAFEDDGDRPILVLEDLSEAHWPPAWEPQHVQSVVAGLDELHAMHLPVDSFSGYMGAEFAGWPRVRDDPQPFLALGLVSPSWLEQALPTLLAAEAEVNLGGEGLLHLDVRSDNLCFRDGRLLLIDWNHACLGNPDVDLAFWLPSLAAEGGPLPEAILPDAGPLAALISGFFAARAGLPVIPNAPRVREIQRIQLEAALPWARRALGL